MLKGLPLAAAISRHPSCYIHTSTDIATTPVNTLVIFM